MDNVEKSASRKRADNRVQEFVWAFGSEAEQEMEKHPTIEVVQVQEPVVEEPIVIEPIVEKVIPEEKIVQETIPLKEIEIPHKTILVIMRHCFAKSSNGY